MWETNSLLQAYTRALFSAETLRWGLFRRVVEQARNINLELNNSWNRATLTWGDNTKGYLQHQGRSRKKREIREVGGKLLLMYVQLRWQLESRSVNSGWKHSGCLYMALFFLVMWNGGKKCNNGYNGATPPIQRNFLNSTLIFHNVWRWIWGFHKFGLSFHICFHL